LNNFSSSGFLPANTFKEKMENKTNEENFTGNTFFFLF
jgi:hypothetical protein